MNIMKEAETQTHTVEAADLLEINKLSKKVLTAEEVYTFAVRLCDNEIDREGERFAGETLQQLATLFVGKSGMFDHQWSALGQTARIYKTQVVEEGGVTAAGDKLCYLKGYAYMLRTAKSADLITEIEGGIKKEVSVGCAVSRAVCSICGKDISVCSHEKGRKYNGKLCYATLLDATDAYEWSFVAVPAQKNAGVMKGMKQEDKLEAEAAMGRRYMEHLREETARLMALCAPELTGELCKAMANGLGEADLLAAQRVYRKSVGEKLHVGPQLTYSGETLAPEADGAFLI
ncbi:MAG: hypothetical protein RR606_00475 [Oscillospiraceae bacterium]